MTVETPAEVPSRGWVLYDGGCGFCSSWVLRWQNVLRRRGFYLAALQEPWVGEWMQMSIEELELDVRLLLTSGHHLKGAAVYRYVMRRIWWALPIYALSVTPGLRQLFDAAYRRFADNRYWISRTCHIPVQPADGP
jgi:predicted DCC family thiol-disulfide oxidoreductase YuxK